MKLWLVYALLSAFFASLTAILAKVGIKGIDSDLATGIRTSVILIFILLIIFFRGQFHNLATLSKTNLLFISLSGIATGLSWIFYFRALQLGKVSLVAPIDKASLALTILLSVIFLGEAISIKSAMGAGLILAGTLILIF